jgi:hypothetical protein
MGTMTTLAKALKGIGSLEAGLRQAPKLTETLSKELGMLRPAVKIGEKITSVPTDKSHYDAMFKQLRNPKLTEADVPADIRGYLTPDDTYLTAHEAVTWVKQYQPDIYRKLPKFQTEHMGLPSHTYAWENGLDINTDYL